MIDRLEPVRCRRETRSQKSRHLTPIVIAIEYPENAPKLLDYSYYYYESRIGIRTTDRDHKLLTISNVSSTDNNYN